MVPKQALTVEQTLEVEIQVFVLRAKELARFRQRVVSCLLLVVQALYARQELVERVLEDRFKNMPRGFRNTKKRTQQHLPCMRFFKAIWAKL